MQFNPDEQVVGIGGSGLAGPQNDTPENPEEFGLRIVSLARFFLEQKENISFSKNPVDQIVFDVFIDNLKVYCGGSSLSELIEIHPLFEGFSKKQLNIFNRFLTNIEKPNCLERLVHDIKQDFVKQMKESQEFHLDQPVSEELAQIADSVENSVSIVDVEPFPSGEYRSFESFVASLPEKPSATLPDTLPEKPSAVLPDSLTEESSAVLPDSFILELSGAIASCDFRPGLQAGADILKGTLSELLVHVNVSHGKRVEILLLNDERSSPDYGVACNFITDLINKVYKVSDAELNTCLRDVFLEESSQFIMSRLRNDQIRDFLLTFLEDLFKMFQLSRVMFSYNNNVNLSFIQDMLRNDKNYFNVLYKSIFHYYSRQNYYKLYKDFSKDKLLIEKKYLNERKKRKLPESERVEIQRKLKTIDLLILNPLDLENLTTKFLSWNSSFSLNEDELALLEFLCVSGVVALREQVVNVNSNYGFGTELNEELLTEALLKMTILSQNPARESSIGSGINKNYYSIFLEYIRDNLMNEGNYIDEPSHLKLINTSDSPLDYLRSTDAFFIITEGKFKDVVIKYDITTNPTKTESKWGSVGLFLKGHSQREILEAFELFKPKVLKYLDDILKKPVPTSIHYYKGLSDSIKD